MKRTIKVGIIQQTCTNDIRHNLSKLHHNIEQVAAAGAQLVVLQELHNTPYFCQTEDTDMFDLAEPVPGPSTGFFRGVGGREGVVLGSVSWLPDTVLYWLLRYSRSVLRGYITIQPSFLTKMAV